MRFIAVASSVRPRIALHAADCHAATSKLRECVRWELHASTAAEALAAIQRDEDTDERGLSVTACPCCAACVS